MIDYNLNGNEHKKATLPCQNQQGKR